MKTWKQILAVATAVAMAVALLSGCGSDKSDIKDTLNEFEYACHTLDVKAILSCIDPSISDPIRLGLAVYTGVAGKDYEDFAEDALDNLVAVVFGEDLDAEDYLSKITISDEKVKVDKKTAKVTCKLNFEVNGEKFEHPATIKMLLNDDKWYVAGIDISTSTDEA